MAGKKAVTSEQNRIRTVLQQQGNKITISINNAMKAYDENNDNIEGLVAACASAETYVTLRKSLLPQIALDSITQAMNGKANVIRKLLNQS